jgi:sortase (surface protein transpeptidase)
METRSKVTQVTGNGTWNSQYGLLYKFEVHFENGEYGTYMSKSLEQNKFVVGQEATYTRDSKQATGGAMYYTIKPVQPQQQSFGGGKPAYQKDPETEKRIARMSVLKVAGDLVVNGVVKIHDLTKVASFLEQYVMTGQDTMTTIYSHAQPKAQEENNDLPF